MTENKIGYYTETYWDEKLVIYDKLKQSMVLEKIGEIGVAVDDWKWYINSKVVSKEEKNKVLNELKNRL